MEPINSKERTSAIIKMALLFLLTLIIILVAVYFDFRVPNKQLDMVKEERDALKVELAQFQKLLDKVNEINALYDEYNENPDRLYGNLERMREPNADLLGLSTDEESMVYKLATRLEKTYHELITAKSLASRAQLKAEDAGDLAQEVDKLKRDLRQCEDDLIRYKRQLME